MKLFRGALCCSSRKGREGQDIGAKVGHVSLLVFKIFFASDGIDVLLFDALEKCFGWFSEVGHCKPSLPLCTVACSDCGERLVCVGELSMFSQACTQVM